MTELTWPVAIIIIVAIVMIVGTAGTPARRRHKIQIEELRAKGNEQYQVLASIPDGAVITGVTLKFRKQGVTGGGDPVAKFNGFMVDMKKGYFGTRTTLQAGDFQASASKTYGAFKPAVSGGWYSINLTSAKAYINKTSSHAGLTQIRLRFKLDDNNNRVANYLRLYSGNAPTSSRPQLIVTYYMP